MVVSEHDYDRRREDDHYYRRRDDDNYYRRKREERHYELKRERERRDRDRRADESREDGARPGVLEDPLLTALATAGMIAGLLLRAGERLSVAPIARCQAVTSGTFEALSLSVASILTVAVVLLCAVGILVSALMSRLRSARTSEEVSTSLMGAVRFYFTVAGLALAVQPLMVLIYSECITGGQS